MTEPGSPAALVRAIGITRATAMVVGTIIGASIFVQPSLVSGAVPSRSGVLLVWACAGALTLIGALITAELASAFPVTGGIYVYLREAYSPLVAWLWGWAMFWSMHTGIISAIATVFARYVGHFVTLDDLATRWVAVAAIGLFSAVNYRGVRQGSGLQTAFTLVKVLAVAAIIVAGAYRILGGSITPAVPDGGWSAGAFFPAMAAGLFAYGGWHMVTYAADETRDATRTIPRALFAGTLIVTIAYMGVNLAYLAVLPVQSVARSTRVAADFADAVVGAGGAAILSALVVISTAGAMTGIILAGPRVYLAMADDGLLPRRLARVHPTFRTPHVAIVLQGVWASLLVLTGSYRALFTRVVYTEWLFFAALAFGIVLLRRRRDYSPRYRVRGYPLLPYIFIAASLAIVGNQLVTHPAESLAGLGIVAAGIPVYLLRKRSLVPAPGRT